MSGFLYYIPGVPDNHDPREGKLSYAFDDRPMGRRCFKGPDGTEGIVFGADGGGAVGYHPERQTWQEVAYLGCWVGYYTEDRPEESDLRRKKTLYGDTLDLAGQSWRIPTARSFEEIDGEPVLLSRLNQYIGVDFATGEWKVGEVQKEYRPLWDVALKYWDFWAYENRPDDKNSTAEVELSQAEVLEMAELALATNYRVSRVELSLCNVLSSSVCADVMAIVIDLKALEALLKKTDLPVAESSATDNGKPGVTEATPQPSLTG